MRSQTAWFTGLDADQRDLVGRTGPLDGLALELDRLLGVIEPGEVIGDIQVFDPAPWTFAAAAMTEVLVVSVAHDDALAWVGRHPEVSPHMLQRPARRLAGTSRAGADLLPADARARVAREVLALAGRHDVDGVVRHGLTQRQLGDIVVLSRERVNNVLADFWERGWTVVGRGCFTVLDRESLETQAAASSADHSHRS